MDAAKGKEDESRSNSGKNTSTIFSKLRNNLASNSIGSMFNSTGSSSASSSTQNLALDSWDHNDLPKPLAQPNEGVTPTPTRPPSPRRFASVKNIFSNLTSRSSRTSQPVQVSVTQTQVLVEEEGGNTTPHYEPLTPLLDLAFTSSLEYHQMETAYSPSQYQPLSASSSYGSSELDDTPPLTPESLVADLSPVSPSSPNLELGYKYAYEYNQQTVGGGGHEEVYMDMQAAPDAFLRHSMEIKEGKKPERPIDYDVLLADISDAPADDAVLTSGDSQAGGNLLAEDDKDEWFGLEYTLELSTRERRASETHSFSAGEHSKSRESWAAIHQGTVHPFFEDEEYHQWKNWHRYLDRLDEKRKHRRGRAFKVHAKELAWFYVDEVHARDLMYWQTEVYGDVDKEIYERLRVLQAHRPDPYYPPQKHDIAWYLKRARSVASLRELRPLPEVQN
ncbi:MFS domain-containing protein [Mycena sanguinolenta]|uniref:MFS domain-containing protein n=1 Tax=Mycena sanguinolenta TaxID=230812 RepID=A0A8H6Y7Y7_9AGAR|nr:MFS domain-containing protein [Mycena sanguinolenta]